MKINLEKELIKQNARISTPAELLLIKEHEKVGVLSHDLSRIGFTHLEEGKSIKSKISKLKQETLRFDQSRVFHISQIKEVAEKYYLRFLPTHYYKGSVDPELPFKIGNFEAAYGVEMGSKRRGCDNNSYILAPKESFQLEEEPKDPLLFYMINEEYFYLVHKWGNDLSVTRRLKGIFSSPVYSYLSFMIVSIIAGWYLVQNIAHPVGGFITFQIFSTFLYGGLIVGFKREGFFAPNKWNSPIK